MKAQERTVDPPDVPAFPEAHQPWRISSPAGRTRRTSPFAGLVRRRWFQVAGGVALLCFVAFVGDTIASILLALFLPADAEAPAAIQARQSFLFVRLILEDVPVGFLLGWLTRNRNPFRYLTAVGIWMCIVGIVQAALRRLPDPSAWLGMSIYVLPFLYLGGAMAAVLDEKLAARRRRQW